MDVKNTVMICLSAAVWWLTTGVAWSETLLERGTYLVNSIAACGNCHTSQAGPMAGVEQAGGFLIEAPPFKVFAPNITPDVDTGVGNWTEAQLITAIREGIRPDGSVIGPPMPIALYRSLSDRDVKAIVTYLRTVKPVKHAVPRSEYRISLPPNYGPPVGAVPEVSPDDPVAYGAYLAGPVGHCMECHTPQVNGRPDFANQLGAGRFPFSGPWGVSVSRNITPDPESGLGKWTDTQIKTAITQGVRPDGSRLLPPMGFSYYARMTEADLNAIVAYLRSLKPIQR
jgi:mono/diheme cytochrome c family protein